MLLKMQWQTKKLSSIDEVDVDAVAKDVTAQMKAQKTKK